MSKDNFHDLPYIQYGATWRAMSRECSRFAEDEAVSPEAVEQ